MIDSWKCYVRDVPSVTSTMQVFLNFLNTDCKWKWLHLIFGTLLQAN